MKRKLSFRAWNLRTKKFVTDEYLLTDSVSGTMEIAGVTYKKDPDDMDDEVAVLQFVGVCDKNGKDIYEGDVVIVDAHSVLGGGEWAEQTCVVSFINGAFVVDSVKFHNTIYRTKSHLTVIGNIYENPELIEANNVQSSEPKVEDGY